MAVASDQDSSEDQIKCPHVADCLTTSAWVCLIVLQNSATGPEKQLTKPILVTAISPEKLMKAYCYHTRIQLCSHAAQLIMWLTHGF